jgi:hypothetical protein
LDDAQLQALSAGVPSFQTGGFTCGGFLPDTYLDLASADPYFLLPCMQAAIFLLTVEVRTIISIMID